MRATWKLFYTIVFAMVSLGLLGLVETLHARPNHHGQGAPSNVLYFEQIAGLAIEPTVPGGQTVQHVSLEAAFMAFGQQFDLHLEPNDIFAPGAQNHWVAGGTNTSETPTTTFYKGAILGRPGTWVRVSLHDGVIEGMVWTPEEIYFVESGRRFFGRAAAPAADMVIYRLSDTTSDWQPGSCAADHPAVGEVLGQHAISPELSSEYDALRAELQALAGSTLEQLDVGLVADYEYYQQHGAASATDMQNIVNQIDGIYRAELGVTLRIAQTVVHTTVDDPFSSTTDPFNLLSEFTNYKGNLSSPVHNTGIAHLFTNRELAGSTIGIAWLGTVCHSSYGSGVSQDFTTTNKSLVLLTAHEMGHNLDAPHDNQSGSPCAATPFGYIMNPWISTNLNLEFSACSKTEIAPTVAGGSCFVTVAEDPLPCSYSISPQSRSHSDLAGTDSVSVSADGGCPWVAESNASWIIITSGTSGSGAGTVNYDVAANLGTSARSGTLTIAGQTFTLTQASAQICTYSITPTGRTHKGTLKSKGGVKVITESGCKWTATSNVNWIKLLKNASGNGTLTVTYEVAVNTTSGERVGTMTVAGQTFTVTQQPGLGTAACSYSITPTERTHRARTSRGGVKVVTQTGCPWTAKSNVSWITILKNASGDSTLTVTYEVAPNIGDVRVGTMTVAGEMFTATQQAP